MKKVCLTVVALVAATALVGCKSTDVQSKVLGVNQKLTKVEACKGMKRQMQYNHNSNNMSAKFISRSQTRALRERYIALGCDKLI